MTDYLNFNLQNEAIDVDIDEILDMDTDDIRRSHLIVSTSFSTMTLHDSNNIYPAFTEITVSLQTPAIRHIEVHWRSVGSRKNPVNRQPLTRKNHPADLHL